jgi:hypothetical protein
MRRLKSLIERVHDGKGVFVGTTDEGCFIDAEHGADRVRIDMDVELAIDVAASIIVSTVRAAVKSKGYTLRSYLNAIDSQIQSRLHEAASVVTSKGGVS